MSKIQRPSGWARLGALAGCLTVISSAFLYSGAASACDPVDEERRGRVVGVAADGLILYRLDVNTPESFREGSRRDLLLIGADGRQRAVISFKEATNGYWEITEPDVALSEPMRQALSEIPNPTSFAELTAGLSRVLGITPLRPSPKRLSTRSEPKTRLCAAFDVIDAEGPVPFFDFESDSCSKAQVELFEHPRSGYLFLRIRYDDDWVTIDDDRWIDAAMLEGARLAKRAEKAHKDRQLPQAMTLAKQALALLPESDAARWVLARSMADAGYSWSAARTELNIAYPPHHNCSFVEGPAGLYAWLSQRSPWAEEAKADPWISTMLVDHAVSHHGANSTDLLYLPPPRLTRPEVEEVAAADIKAPPPPPAIEPPIAPPPQVTEPPKAEASGVRFFLGGIPVTFDLGTLLVVGAHILFLGGYALAKRSSSS